MSSRCPRPRRTPPSSPRWPSSASGSPRLTPRATGPGAAGPAAVLVADPPAELAAACRHALPGPVLPEWVAPLALVVPGQLLVEALARKLGIDPDLPRGLRKVTQTDERPGDKQTSG